MNTNSMIETLNSISNAIQPHLDQARQIDGSLAALFEAAHEHTRDAARCLSDAKRTLDSARAKAEKLAALAELDNAPREFFILSEVYLFDYEVDTFNECRAPCRLDMTMGARLGIYYEAGEAIAKIVCAEPERRDEDYSWQDHGLPKELKEALQLDPKFGRYYAPGWIPVRILEQLAEKGYYDLLPAGKNVRIRLAINPKQKDEFRNILDAIQQS